MHEQQTIVSGNTAPVVTITVKDPAALGWERRADIRQAVADELDWRLNFPGPIGVDIMEARDD